MRAMLYLGLLVTVLLTACGTTEEKNQESQSPTKIFNDNVLINHQQCGEGEITLLFIHGWCINQTYWSKQVDFFCENYQVVTIDLPGFGKSGKNRSTWTIQQYGEDVKAVINALDLNNVVLIGHSMGGDVILEAAKGNENVIALVGIDNFKDVGEVYDENIQAEIDGFINMLKANFSEIAPAYAEGSLFHPGTDSLVKSRVMGDFRNADSLAAIGTLEALLDYGDRESKLLTDLKKPLYLINSDATPTDSTALKARNVDYTVIDIPATGHYPMIEKPEIFNKLLKQALEQIDADRKTH